MFCASPSSTQANNRAFQHNETVKCLSHLNLTLLTGTKINDGECVLHCILTSRFYQELAETSYDVREING